MAPSDPGAGAGAGDAGPDLPPLLSGEPADGDPLAVAAARARAGVQAGLIVHRIRPDRLAAAIVLAPDDPLEASMAMVLAAANGFADAFGALAPSEIAAQFDWPGGFRINGARCGGLRAAADTRDPGAVPGWLVIALDLPFLADDDTREPGATPDRTTLWEEGCGDIAPRRLLESWSRHMLVRINDWHEDGMARLHADWTGRAFALGRNVEVRLGAETHRGRFAGLDERGGMLLQSGSATRLLPLSLMLVDT